MKTAIVPAQITTVEDKIVGNLNILQIAILFIPALIDGTIYAILPPKAEFTNYKIAIAFILTAAVLLLAIRFKGKVLAEWIAIVLRYMARPHFYLYDKNDTYLRAYATEATAPVAAKTINGQKTEKLKPKLSIAKTVEAEALLNNPTVSLKFKPHKRGGLHVIVAKAE